MSIPVKKNFWESVKRVSIDEISMRKGKGSFVTVVSDIEAGNLIEMIDSHRQQDIIEALIQYSGQFLKRDASAIQQRSEKSECNLNPK
jgi:transposase